MTFDQKMLLRLASLFLIVSLLCFLYIIFNISVQKRVEGVGLLLNNGRIYELISEYDGILQKWFYDEGDEFFTGSIVAQVKSEDKSIEEIKASKSFELIEIVSNEGDKIFQNSVLAFLSDIESKDSDLEILGFISGALGQKIDVGAKVFINPSVSKKNKHGFLQGEVYKISKLPMSEQNIKSLVKLPYISTLVKEKIGIEPYLVRVKVKKGSWTKVYESYPNITAGIFTKFYIVKEETSLLKQIFKYNLWF